MPTDRQPSALDALFWRDEILQVLFWLQGEELAKTVRAQDLLVFLKGDEDTIAHHLEKLAGEGLLVRRKGRNGRAGVKHYALSETGRQEGGRRFADAFEGMQKQGHGECSPDCDCNWGETGHALSCPSHHSHHHPH